MEMTLSTGRAARPAARMAETGESGAGRMWGVAARLALAFLLLSSLPACSMLRSALGMTKHPPDEFAIMTKAPLVMPPDFSLRPPRPGAEQPQVATPAAEARQTIFGVNETQTRPDPGQSQGEFALLQKAGAEDADPGIRDTLKTDLVAKPKKRGFLSRMLWPFGGSKDKSKDETVNAAAEKERLGEVIPHPTAPVDQGALPSPGVSSVPPAPDQTPSEKGATPKPKKKGIWQRINPF